MDYNRCFWKFNSILWCASALLFFKLHIYTEPVAHGRRCHTWTTNSARRKRKITTTMNHLRIMCNANKHPKGIARQWTHTKPNRRMRYEMGWEQQNKLCASYTIEGFIITFVHLLQLTFVQYAPRLCVRSLHFLLRSLIGLYVRSFVWSLFIVVADCFCVWFCFYYGNSYDCRANFSAH